MRIIRFFSRFKNSPLLYQTYTTISVRVLRRAYRREKANKILIGRKNLVCYTVQPYWINSVLLACFFSYCKKKSAIIHTFCVCFVSVYFFIYLCISLSLLYKFENETKFRSNNINPTIGKRVHWTWHRRHSIFYPKANERKKQTKAKILLSIKDFPNILDLSVIKNRSLRKRTTDLSEIKIICVSVRGFIRSHFLNVIFYLIWFDFKCRTKIKIRKFYDFKL